MPHFLRAFSKIALPFCLPSPSQWREAESNTAPT